jgi:glutathione S-transferase
MYQLYGSTKTRTMRVVWLLHELGQPFDHFPEAPRSENVRRLHSSGKVPVLVVDGTILTDSTAIMTYLCDKHGDFTHPAGSLDRARQDGLTQMLLDEFDALLWTGSRHSFILPPDQRVPAIKDSLRWEFANHAKRLADRLAGPFLMGDRMTLPDIILTHCLIWAKVAKFDIAEPDLLAYLDRMCARPAYLSAAAT